MNILERTKILNKVAECDRKSAEAVAQNAALTQTVAELIARIVSLEERPRIGRPPKVKEDGPSPN